MHKLVKNNFCPASRMNPFSSQGVVINFASKLTNLPLESRKKCFTNVFNIVDVPAINLFFFFFFFIEKQNF